MFQVKLVLRVFKESFKNVSRKFYGFSRKIEGCIFKIDSREIQGYLKEVQRVFQGSFKAVSKPFYGSIRGVKCVLRKFQKKVSRVFQECFNKIFFNFVVARISSQVPEQKEGLFFQ